ncbi:uncharacterized protein LOC113273666 [Papaver somniferum]|uniref:uncharacterized protein LOC113273666 n=1 Tax=Papaver somniferum TaxID=3469 RepID=UPI000E7006D7|nr:uncharacterized protein LOC113273666 [Papaver somniferum]
MTQDEYEEHCMAKSKLVIASNVGTVENEDGFIHVENDAESLEEAEDQRITKRSRNQVIQDNGSNPSIEGPILANHGGTSNDDATQNTYAEQIDEVEMDTREIFVADTKIESMKNQRSLPTEETGRDALQNAMQE